MYRRLPRLSGLTGGVLAVCLLTATVAAQGGPKRYAVTQDRALAVTREVLVQQGFFVVRVETVRETSVLYYRRGNNGKGQGTGKLEKLVIRRDSGRVLFDETPVTLLVAIDLRLRL